MSAFLLCYRCVFGPNTIICHEILQFFLQCYFIEFFEIFQMCDKLKGYQDTDIASLTFIDILRLIILFLIGPNVYTTCILLAGKF